MLEKLTTEELWEYCSKNNIELPDNYNNKRYVIRCIEQGGINNSRKVEINNNIIVVGISTDRDNLRKRIKDRIEQFFDNNVSDFIFYGVFCILNSEQFDNYYRMINGSHTLNSYEFQNLLFPKEEILEKIGREYLKTEEKNSIEKCSEIFEKYIKNK